MKRFVALILFFVAYFPLLQSQTFTCPHDTAVNGGFPTMGDFQWSGNGDATIGECPTCVPMNRFYSWDLLDTGNVLIIHGNFFPPCDTVEIRVVKDCRYVYKDTCLTLPLTGSGCEFILDIDPPINAQLLVYWRTGGTDSIGIIANEVNDGSPLSVVLYDMHLCSVLPIQAPQPTESHYYYELSTLIQGNPIPVKREDFKPNSEYVRAKSVYWQ